jgi:hypothetical protein
VTQKYTLGTIFRKLLQIPGISTTYYQYNQHNHRHHRHHYQKKEGRKQQKRENFDSITPFQISTLYTYNPTIV